ncbi:hypothetical protein ABMA27_005090 [Loxostege sticticalis]|uniref:BTB domain-containing protein n=1 Tax=Loxostege sticticalis TaxID=481309 RepID=A0ABR3HLS6_LOXSC
MYFFTAKFTKTQCEEENYGTMTTKVIGDWQIGCKDIKMRMVNLYYSDSWTDCTFLVGSEQLVSAHKVVLAAASPVFAAMFYGGMPEKGPIQIDDIEPDTFIEMLRYIYTDNTDIISFNDACALYYAAKKYMLLHLKTECLEYLINNLTAADCCLAYEFAQMFDEKDLLKACEELMKTKTMEVLHSRGFQDASLKTVHFIYSMDNLTITSEVDLFEALEHYVKVNDMSEELGHTNESFNSQMTGSPKEDNDIGDWKQSNVGNENGSAVRGEYDKTKNGIFKDCMENDVKDQQNVKNGNASSPKKYKESNSESVKDCVDNEETKPQDIKHENVSAPEKIEIVEKANTDISERITVRHILKLIRFLTMSAEEFTSVPAASSLLTQTEVLALLINIINLKKSKVPMPEGFSTKLEKRYSKADPLDVMKDIRLHFTVPDCERFEDGDIIHSSTVHFKNSSWELRFYLSDNFFYVSVNFIAKGISQYYYNLRIRINEDEDKDYLYLSKGAMKLTELLENWKEIKDKYLEDGALSFDVAIWAPEF